MTEHEKPANQPPLIPLLIFKTPPGDQHVVIGITPLDSIPYSINFNSRYDAIRTSAVNFSARQISFDQALAQTRQSGITRPDHIKLINGADLSILVTKRNGPQDDLIAINPDKKDEPHITTTTIEIVKALASVEELLLPDESQSVNNKIFVTSINGNILNQEGVTSKKDQKILLIFGQQQIATHNTPPLHASDSQLAAFAMMLNRKLISEASKYGEQKTKKTLFGKKRYVDISPFDESRLKPTSTPEEIKLYFQEVLKAWTNTPTDQDQHNPVNSNSTQPSFEVSIDQSRRFHTGGTIVGRPSDGVYQVNFEGVNKYVIRTPNPMIIKSSRPLGTSRANFTDSNEETKFTVQLPSLFGSSYKDFPFNNFEANFEGFPQGRFNSTLDWYRTRLALNIKLHKFIPDAEYNYLYQLKDFYPYFVKNDGDSWIYSGLFLTTDAFNYYDWLLNTTIKIPKVSVSNWDIAIEAARKVNSSDYLYPVSQGLIGLVSGNVWRQGRTDISLIDYSTPQLKEANSWTSKGKPLSVANFGNHGTIITTTSGEVRHLKPDGSRGRKTANYSNPIHVLNTNSGAFFLSHDPKPTDIDQFAAHHINLGTNELTLPDSNRFLPIHLKNENLPPTADLTVIETTFDNGKPMALLANGTMLAFNIK